jgi:spore coat polysaccharide biosynthesis protein SpsF (cytidylyltransferase family)
MSNPIEKKQIWLDAFKNTLRKPAVDIEKTVKALEDYEIEKALREALETKKLKTRLQNRQRKLNKNFVWTPEKN